MRPPRVTMFGLAVVSIAGAVALGAELQRPQAAVDTHGMRNTAASRLINDPRLAAVLTQSAQHALQPLKTSSNDLYPPPLTRAVPGTGVASTGPGTWITPNPPLAFNNDQSGFPQNTESVSNCSAGGTIVGAYNDFRNTAINSDISAWSISTDGGTSLTNSNFLPGVTVTVVASGPASGAAKGGGGGGPASGTSHVYVATQGDAVIRATQSCSVYATSLAFGFNPGPAVNAIVVDESSAATLASCTSERACWPQRRTVAVDTSGQAFFDKPTIAVDPNTPNAPVWVGFTEFSFDQFGNMTSSLDVVRCDSALLHCSPPVALETDGASFPAPSPTAGGGAGAGGGGGPGGLTTPTWASIGLGSGGATYVSWATISQPFLSGRATVTVNMASAPPGKLTFGAPVVVTVIGQPVLQPLASEPFQVNAFPRLAVSHAGTDRLHIVYGQCQDEALGICERSKTVLATSLTGAAGTWSFSTVDPGPVSDFFPMVTTDGATGNLLVGLLTNRFDAAQHDYDVVVVPVNAATGAQSPALRVSARSIEPSNDSLIGPFSIGDYWELTAFNGAGWAHFTTTQRLQALLGQGVPVPQEDNALSRFRF